MPRAPKTASDSLSGNVTASQSVQKKKYPWLILTAVFLFILLAASTGAASYFYYQLKKAAPAESAEDREMKRIITQVGRFMELPDETPTLATVTDKTKLAAQPFFQKAENGDKVLLYSTAGRAILYRPSTQKVIDVTVINLADKAQSVADVPVPAESAAAPAPDPVPASETAKEKPVKAALYNGSAKIGVTNAFEDKLIAQFPDIIVDKKEKAAGSDYAETLMIDLTGANEMLVKELAERFGGTVGTFPESEIKPETDILIIVGNKP